MRSPRVPSVLTAGLLALVSGCGAHPNDRSWGMTRNFCERAGVTVDIAGNSGHRLYIPYPEVINGAQKTYTLEGDPSHSHTVTLSPSDFGRLRKDQGVLILSSRERGHTHSVHVQCGTPDDITEELASHREGHRPCLSCD